MLGGQPPMKKVLLSWSSGKDSAWSFHLLSQQPAFQVAALVTTFNGAADRVAIHAVRRSLVEAQAERMKLPLWAIELPWPCSNAEYEAIMSGVWRRATEAGIEAVAFGDLFLQDIRAYRERQLGGTGLEPLFPVWDIPTGVLARHLIAAGIKAKITCVDAARLDKSFAGRDFDLAYLASLPATTDPCGENGEFHSFVYEAPFFTHGIDVCPGEIIEREGFFFADLCAL